MQPRSQISSSYIAHKTSAPGAQQLSLTSSTTLHRPCSLRGSSAQAIQPTSPPAQSEELSHPTQDVLLRSQFSSDSSAHQASSSRSLEAQSKNSTAKRKPKSCPAQTFNSSYANQEINLIHAEQREMHK